MRETRIVILGPPGSGKGTRARIISDMYGIPVVTTGDMLREAAAKGTEEGLVAKEYMERGELVPDSIVNSVVGERLSRPDTERGFVLDGYPRSLSQAEALDRILEEEGASLDYVIYVDVDDETIINRLSKRRSCPVCGAIYHLEDNPPEEPGVCDYCGSRLIQRSDDREEIVRRRLEVYREKTKPLLERYRGMGKVRKISGDMEIDDIPDALRRLLKWPAKEVS